jgi:hypothetical protein
MSRSHLRPPISMHMSNGNDCDVPSAPPQMNFHLFALHLLETQVQCTQ